MGPVGKSNCFLDVESTQANPIFKIAVDILKNTNFFRAFTASSTIPSIYIQQFWDTIRFDKDKGYICQLDEQRFYLTKATLRDALQLPSDNSNFTPPPNSNTIISFVNNLGYPNVVRTLSGVVTNDMYQPWRALVTIINLWLTGKTSGDFESRRELQYCTVLVEMNLALHAEGKNKVNPLVISGVRFTKLIINYLQSKHKFHKRPGSSLHLPTEESALGYLKISFKNTKRVTKYQRYLAGEAVSDDDAPAPKPPKGATTKSTRKPKPQSSKTAPVAKPAASITSKSSASQPSKPTPAPAKPQQKKRKLVEDTTEPPSQAKRSKAGKVLKRERYPALLSWGPLPPVVFREPDTGKIQPLPEVEGKGKEKVEESLKEVPGAHGGPLPPEVFREPNTRKFQPFLEVSGKGKEEQTAQVLLNLQTLKKKNPDEQFIFQRCTPAPTVPSSHEESSSLYAELGQTDSETNSDNEVSRDINPKAHIKGQAGSDPGK
ncbi:hypothetical protein Tco_1277815 [Tanacetum coccineum]